MSEDSSSRQRDWKIIFGVGCLVGTTLTILGIYLFLSQSAGNHSMISGQILQPTGNATANVSGSDPEYTLRLIQAIGILLPLFTGLLRLTTSDQSEVGEDINKYLFIGILLLVVGGSTAVIGGIAANMAGVLRTALVFVLLTFIMIGVVAGMMYTKMPTETEEEASKLEGRDEGDRETVEDEGEQDKNSEETLESDEAEPTRAELEPEESTEETDHADETGDETDSTSRDRSEQL